jgi:CRP-like cAMP-binding protein
MQVNAGQVLWRTNDNSDSFYIVINGRLRAISDSTDAVKIEGEYGQGDTVGELDVITSSPRRNTVHAIRDTELIRMPRTLFNAISARCVVLSYGGCRLTIADRNPKTTSQYVFCYSIRITKLKVLLDSSG